MKCYFIVLAVLVNLSCATKIDFIEGYLNKGRNDSYWLYTKSMTYKIEGVEIEEDKDSVFYIKLSGNVEEGYKLKNARILSVKCISFVNHERFLKSLTNAMVTKSNYRNGLLKDLSSLQSLTHLILKLGDLEITDSDIYQLSKLEKLTHLNISWDKMTDRSLSFIKSFKSLKEFIIEGNIVSPKVLGYLDCEKIESLYIPVHWDWKKLMEFENFNFPNLKSLGTNNKSFDDTCLLNIATVYNLSALDVRGTSISVKQLEEFIISESHHLKHVMCSISLSPQMTRFMKKNNIYLEVNR